MSSRARKKAKFPHLIQIGTDSDLEREEKAVGRVPRASKKSGESAFSQSVLESLNCPITAALPVMPVLAEDGRIYERAAIKRWLSKKAKSPLTNAPMGKHLADASVTTRPLVLSAIENGVVDDESAAAWHLGSAKAKLAGDLPGELSSVKVDLDRAGAFASTPEIELLRRAADVKIRAAAVKLETESLAKETESLLNEGEAAGVDEIETILSAAKEPGEYEFDNGGYWERRMADEYKEVELWLGFDNIMGKDIEAAKKILKRARSSYTRAAEEGHRGAIAALARMDAIAALARLDFAGDDDAQRRRLDGRRGVQLGVHLIQSPRAAALRLGERSGDARLE
mmetsp:Transcript_28619/g.93670  ORF Transcript_28619/g.93670 Transcript_28619/m.93670 type:complete len:340 (-) Transcript_28619:79-1098(-)